MIEMTRGPWQVERTDEGEVGIFSVSEKTPYGGQAYVIIPNETIKVSDANMMSAAPDLASFAMEAISFIASTERDIEANAIMDADNKYLLLLGLKALKLQGAQALAKALPKTHSI